MAESLPTSSGADRGAAAVATAALQVAKPRKYHATPLDVEPPEKRVDTIASAANGVEECCCVFFRLVEDLVQSQEFKELSDQALKDFDYFEEVLLRVSSLPEVADIFCREWDDGSRRPRAQKQLLELLTRIQADHAKPLKRLDSEVAATLQDFPSIFLPKVSAFLQHNKETLEQLAEAMEKIVAFVDGDYFQAVERLLFTFAAYPSHSAKAYGVSADVACRSAAGFESGSASGSASGSGYVV